jgi:uncharacterized protein (TIGR02598 family)
MKNRRRQLGFSLVEVTLAIGVAAFCMIPIFALIPIGLNTNQDTLRQTTAASLASTISADLRATPADSTTSPYFQLNIPGTGGGIITTNFYLSEDGIKLTDPATTGPSYLATVVFTPSQEGTLNASTARILITWPALPNQANGNLPTRFSGSFDTVIGLNRN